MNNGAASKFAVPELLWVSAGQRAGGPAV